MIERKVIEAAKDYKYLLNRGYNADVSLNLVSNRYALSKYEKLLLYRCVHDDTTIEMIKLKTVPPSFIKNKEIILDGFNVLLTIVSMLENDYLFVCDDGFVRDLRSLRSRRLLVSNELLKSALGMIKEYVSMLKPSRAIFVLDKQVSWSATLSKVVTNLTGFTTILSDRADKEVIVQSSRCIVSSSDIVILLKAPYVFDVAGEIVKLRNYGKVVNILKYLKGW